MLAVVVGRGSDRGERAAQVATELSVAHVVLTPAVTGRHPSVEPLAAGLEQLGEDLDLPRPVIEDLTGRLLPATLDVLVAAAEQVTAEVVLDIDLPASDLLEGPQRAARALRSLVPVIARWDILLAPRGVGALRAPDPAVLDACRSTADLLDRLDAALTAPSTSIHLATGDGPAARVDRAAAGVCLSLMGRVAGPTPLGAPAPGGPRVRRRPDDWWELEVDLPGLRAGDVDLARDEDDLLVSCAGRRRAVPLPPVLRRCVVERAGMRSGVLTVQLSPDPGKWPR